MRRLIYQHKNSPEAYNKIYEERQGKVDWQDIRRQKAMLKYFNGGPILDIGCLDSSVPDILIELRLEGIISYLGTDTATEAIRHQNELFYDDKGVNFIVDDIFNTKIDRQFDYVLLGEVLEHLEEPDKAVHQAMRLVKSNGYLVISVPYEEYKEFGAVDKDRHIWSFDKKDFEFLKQYGKVKFKVLGSQYFPYKYCWPQLIIYIKKYD
ncbi:class I SAM-dependent methyltransferase [Candidatus Dojkabacteria bacterium]|jgi:SAM-dependent methyltransferase|nr:class I SAM-dependent methyltransferase [Candidatus Dojkabacteria bacterium]